MTTHKKTIFYSWDSYVADILTNNHKHQLWKDIFENKNMKSGVFNIPCVFTEVDPKIDKHRKRPIGNKNIDSQTVYFCLSHFDSNVVYRGTAYPKICKKNYQKINCVIGDDYNIFNLDDNPLIAIWSALPRAISTEKIEHKKPLVHIHLRKEGESNKIIDRSFEAVVLKSSKLANCNSYNNDMFGHEQELLEIEITPPSIFSICLAYYKKNTVQHLTCTYCGAWHTDLGIFNLTPHKKHLCGSCGYFFDVDLPVSCSNALAALPNNWNSSNKNTANASKDISIRSIDYDKVDIWSWSPAAVWTMKTPEIINGIHVHAYKNGKRVIDETFRNVEFDGCLLRWQDLLINSLQNCDIKNKSEIINDIQHALIY